MGDADIITLESDEEGDVADLVVGPNGTAMPVSHVRKQRSYFPHFVITPKIV